MTGPRPEKLIRAIQELEAAYQGRQQALTDHVMYSGIAKCFEVCLEYAWKHLKSKVEGRGLEDFAPKDVVKMAGKIGVTGNMESWIQFINARNFAAHDYLGVMQQEYLDLIGSFIKEVKKIK